MNAMLEPRMVAARIHGADLALQGIVRAPATITASSQGSFMLNLDADGFGLDSDHHPGRPNSHFIFCNTGG
jgi:hypothetical protein